MGTDPYRPISCALHSELELAIMHACWLELDWRENGQRRSARLRPRDLQTREGSEYLILEDDSGTRMRIRLDHVISFVIR